MTSTALIAQKLKRARFNPPHGGPQEKLAWIATGEANLLKRIGGAGQRGKFGIKSYENLYGHATPQQTRDAYSAPSNNQGPTGGLGSNQGEGGYSTGAGNVSRTYSGGQTSSTGHGSSDSASSRSSNGNNFSFSGNDNSSSKLSNALSQAIGKGSSSAINGFTGNAAPMDMASAVKSLAASRASQLGNTFQPAQATVANVKPQSNYFSAPVSDNVSVDSVPNIPPSLDMIKTLLNANMAGRGIKTSPFAVKNATTNARSINADTNPDNYSADAYAPARSVASEYGQYNRGLPPTNVADPAAQARNYFLSQGYSPTQAAGWAGGIEQESAFNPNAFNPKDSDYARPNEDSGSIGYGQWNHDRRNAFEAFKPDPSMITPADESQVIADRLQQLKFMNSELNSTETAARDKMFAAQTPQQAAMADLAYERASAPAMGNRIKYAKEAAAIPFTQTQPSGAYLAQQAQISRIANPFEGTGLYNGPKAIDPTVEDAAPLTMVAGKTKNAFQGGLGIQGYGLSTIPAAGVARLAANDRLTGGAETPVTPGMPGGLGMLAFGKSLTPTDKMQQLTSMEGVSGYPGSQIQLAAGDAIPQISADQEAAAQPGGAGFAPNGNINLINPNSTIGKKAPLVTKLANLIANRPYDPRTAATQDAQIADSIKPSNGNGGVVKAKDETTTTPATTPTVEAIQALLNPSYSYATKTGKYVVDAQGQYWMIDPKTNQYVKVAAPAAA